MIVANIGKDVYEAKNKEMQFRRQEIENRLKQMAEPAKDDRETLGNVITMMSKSAETFASSKPSKDDGCSDSCFRTYKWRGQPSDIL